MDQTRVIFDSRSTRFKKPSGAVPAGTVLFMRLLVNRHLDVHDARIIVKFDADGSVRKYPMKREEDEVVSSSTVAYEGTFDVAERGLYWYYFEVDTDFGTIKVVKSTDRRSAVSVDPNCEPACWQQTVYERAYKDPDWLYGGIIYHIFVDRFNHEGEYVYMDGKRTRDDWGGMPEYKPVNGRIYNNDFFGGNLSGIKAKIPYLRDLGVTCIYLSPVFEAYSNHKYDTGDYNSIDPMFGTTEDFESLCAEAEANGIRVILDGVFAHTGSDSIYFNRYKHYGEGGAYNDPDSPYRDWYCFDRGFSWDNWDSEGRRHGSGKYECWWGIDTLPRINKNSESYRVFMNGPDGIIRNWLRHGASGWRLDVVDELPADFLSELVSAAKTEKPDAFIVGEVWEDASNKMAYDERKNYFRGDRLDSATNYPLKDAIIRCVRYGEAAALAETVENQWETYPHYIMHTMMNILGTHDSVRILTALGGREMPGDANREWMAANSLTPEEYQTAKRLLKIAAVLQMTLPGVPCIYYGDEAGLEGYKDPFNRKCYPWGSEDKELVDWYRRVAAIRRAHEAFARGEYRTIDVKGGMYAFGRYIIGSEQSQGIALKDEVITVVNCGTTAEDMWLRGHRTDLLTNRSFEDRITVAPGEVLILE